MKKFLSIIMALALVLALSVSVYAAEVPNAVVVFEAEGPSTATNWWYDAWLDSDQKVEFSKAIYSGEANYIVLAFEGEYIGFQSGFQDTTAWVNYMFHVNYPDEPAPEYGVGIAGSEKIETVDGISYVYLSIDTLMTFLADNNLDYSAGTGYNWIIGAPGETPLVGMYVVNAVVEEPADPEETVEEAPTPEVTDTTTEEPADTGLALAVVPMLVAAVAVVASKRR